MPPSGNPSTGRRVPDGVLYLSVGLALAPVFTFTPRLRYMGWLLSSLLHELGHTAFAWVVGCPAMPAIRLDGHAMARHWGWKPVVALIGAALVALLVRWLWQSGSKRLRVLAGAIVPVYLLVLLHRPGREVGHLLAGHMGELALAGVFFWRAWTGWFVGGRADRVATATVAWYLTLNNAYLCYGIAYVPSVRSWYYTSGSFNLVNDYVRIAEEWLRCPIKWVVLPVLAVAVAVPVVSIWLGKTHRD